MARKLLTALVLALLIVPVLRSNTKQILFEYIPTKTDLWLRPMVSPLVQVKVLEGKAPNPDRRTIMCTQVYKDHTTMRDGVEVVSHVVVFLCEDGTALEMTNVYFGDTK